MDTPKTGERQLKVPDVVLTGYRLGKICDRWGCRGKGRSPSARQTTTVQGLTHIQFNPVPMVYTVPAEPVCPVWFTTEQSWKIWEAGGELLGEREGVIVDWVIALKDG